MSVEPHRNGHPMHTPHPRNASAAPVPEPPIATGGAGDPAAPPAFGGRPPAMSPPRFAPPPDAVAATIPGQRYRREPSPFGPPTGGFPAQPGFGYPGPAAGYRPAPHPFETDPGGGLGLDEPPNTLAILSLVFAFCSPLAGLVLGIIARKQIAGSGERGDGLALAGIIVGAVCTLGTAAWTISMIIAWARVTQLLP